MSEAGSPTRTAPAQPPEGFWRDHPPYRNYVLFGASGALLWLGALVLLRGVLALGEGVAAWQAYLERLGGVLASAAMLVVLVGTLLFAIRWLRMVKPFTVALGPLPAPPAPLVLVQNYALFALLTALVLLLCAGVIL